MDKLALDFVEKLHHGGGSVFYFEKWMLVSEKKTRTFRRAVGDDASLREGADSYVSMNNYASDATDKSSRNVESVNGFFVDIDICHNDKVFDANRADELRDRCMELVNEKLGKRYACYCCSGRGIALFYLYDEPISTKDESLIEGHKNAYKAVINAFRSVLGEQIAGGDVEVDSTVTDLARVVRIPGTVNNGAGRCAFVVEQDWSRVYPPEMLWEMFAPYEGEEQASCKKGTRMRQGARSSRRTTPRRSTRTTRRFSIGGGSEGAIPAVYRNNSRGICEAIESLAASRAMGEGSLRNNMLFVYYNNAKVFHSREVEVAVEKTLELNERFDVPLDAGEVRSIIDGVDAHVEFSGVHGDGFYLFSRDKVAEMLCMTEEESAATGFFRSREARQKATQNRESKKRDEEKVVSMWKDGATWRKIASEVGRSNSFVGRVIEAAKHAEIKTTDQCNSKSVQNGKRKIEQKLTSCSDFQNKQGGEEVRVAVVEEECSLSSINCNESAIVYEDEELRSVVNLLLSGRNAYVSGKGGTGKSLVSKAFVSKAREAGRNVMVVAPSGLAAASVGGATVHSAIAMEASEVFERDVKPGFRGVESLDGVDAVLVDECGMLRIDHFAYLVKTIKCAERRYRRGIQLVMVGDFLQIRPVVTDADKELLADYYGEKYTYQAYEDEDLWRSCMFHYARLTKNRRQVDVTFAEFMDKARDGDVSCVPYFRQFERRGVYSIEDGYVHLCAYKSDVRRINNEIIERHMGDASFRVFDGKLIRGCFDANTEAYKRQSFYEGMPVMATCNNAKSGYQNGQIGVVRGVLKDCILVQFGGGDASRCDSTKPAVVKVKMTTIEAEESAAFAFPLVPAYAITIHKCQSQTFDKVVVHTARGGMFEEGQMYVALSRVKSPEGLAICGSITDADIARPRLEMMRKGQTNLRDYEREAILF